MSQYNMIVDIHFIDGKYMEVEITKINRNSIYVESTTYGDTYRINIETGFIIKIESEKSHIKKSDIGYIKKEDIEYILSQKEEYN